MLSRIPSSMPKWIPETRLKRRVEGLREIAPLNPVKVFRLNPDGSCGEFLRVEEPAKIGKYNFPKY